MMIITINTIFIIFCLTQLHLYAPTGAQSVLPQPYKIGYTPYFTTNATVSISMACNQGSYLTQLSLNTVFPEELTCNGYHVFVAPFPGYTGVTYQGKVVTLPVAQMAIYRTTLNGNAFELISGTVSSGQCAGDVFFSVVTNIANDQLGCFGRGVSSYTVNYAFAQVFGQKCPSVCQSRVNGFFSLSTSISNTGAIQ